MKLISKDGDLIQTFFLWISATVADANAVNHNSVNTLLANDLSTFFVKGKPVYSNGPKNPPDCRILCSWPFDNFVLAEELFTQALRSFKTCVLVNS